MLTQFFLTTAIIAHLMHRTFVQVWQADVALVPTERTTSAGEVFEWHVMPQTLMARQLPEPRRVDQASFPEIAARSAMMMDADTRQILWQKNPDEPVSIASITKLMTALVWFENIPPDGLRHIHTFALEDRTPGGKELHLEVGKKLTAFDLLRSSLVGSDNDTAVALVHTTQLSIEEFVAAMNARAKNIGMNNTTFVDPTGLEAKNRATPRDVAFLALTAFANDNIRTPTMMREHLQETVESAELLRVRTTNKLLYDDDVDIRGGKTGYTLEAGYCVAVLAHLAQDNRTIIVVILGAQSDDARFQEAKQLIQWTTQHYDWK